MSALSDGHFAVRQCSITVTYFVSENPEARKYQALKPPTEANGVSNSIFQLLTEYALCYPCGTPHEGEYECSIRMGLLHVVAQRINPHSSRKSGRREDNITSEVLQ